MPATTPDNPGNSPLMAWIRDHLSYDKDYCLIWPFARNSGGYGVFNRASTHTYAHRYICELVHGPCPEGLQAAHSCGRGHDGCVNPRHLSWKTPTENQYDRTDRNGPLRKLSAEDAQAIRDVTNLEHVAITAERFGVTEATIRQIQSGKTWRKDRRVERMLTTEEVQYIRANVRRHGDQTRIAREMGLSGTVIYRVIKRETYKYVP